mmetsp:Transcript_32126/g.51911  ORF Transcript_32126/g.51911 Transcript_32126/m.51911 type:complete len:135 (+) Transcript_32126:241-645(+)
MTCSVEMSPPAPEEVLADCRSMTKCGYCSKSMNTSVFAVRSENRIVALCSVKCYGRFVADEKEQKESRINSSGKSVSPKKLHPVLLHFFQKDARKTPSPPPLDPATILNRRDTLRSSDPASLIRGIVSHVGGKR